MKHDPQSETAVLRLSVRAGTMASQLKAAAELIQWLPGVFRVGADLVSSQLEILLQFPSTGLLRDIHAIVRLANSEITALKVY